MAASFAKALVQIRRAKVQDDSWDSGWVFDIQSDVAPATGRNPPGTQGPAIGENNSVPERCSIDDQTNAEESP